MATGGKRRGRALIAIALILLLLVALVFAATKLLGSTLTSLIPGMAPAVQTTVVVVTPDVKMVNIVIATQKITRGTEITEQYVAEVPYPEENLVEGSFITNIDQVVGKRAKSDIDAQTPLTMGLLVDPNLHNSPAAFQIPRGQVAIPIPVSKLSAVAYGLTAGDHVNVIVTMMMVDLDAEFQSKLPNTTGLVIAPGPTSEGGPVASSASITLSEGSIAGRIELDPVLNQAIYVVPSESQRPRMVSQTLIQDAIVLQVGDFALESAQPAAAATEAAPTGEATPVPEVVLPDTVTLIVNPQDAVTLNYLILSGAKLNLVMRSAGDVDRIATEAVTLQYILDFYGIPNPAKLPYGLEPRLDAIPSVVSPFPSNQGFAAPAQ
jgi:Flp pilus assembly protein CpaB